MPVTDELRRKLKFGSEFHSKINRAVCNRFEMSENELSDRHEQWKKDEESYLAFIPTNEADRLRHEKRRVEGITQQTTLIIPYSYAMLMTAHTYWTSVFLARDPVMQFMGRHGEAEQNVHMLEAILNYQVTVGRMLVPFYVWLLDMGKFGVGILGNYWEDEKIPISEFVSKPVTFLGIPIGDKSETVYQTRLVQGYQGNKVYNVRPYNWFPDPRKSLMDFQMGEFVGVEMDNISVMDLRENEEYINVAAAEKIKSAINIDRGSDQVELPASSDEHLQPVDVTSVATGMVRELYIRLIPKDWGLGPNEHSEKWVFTQWNEKVIIGAQPYGANHNEFPFSIQEYEPDGYALAKRSMMEISKPMTDIMDWLVNTHFFNIRKVLNDSLVVDPSLITMKDLTDPNPGKIIRIRPRGYGAGLLDAAVQQLKVQDVTGTHMNDIGFVANMLQRVHGVTEQVMGQPLPTGRRSASEARQTAAFGINRLKTNAEFASAQGWGPLAQQLVQNTQQYMTLERQFRIAGDTVNVRGAELFMQITPDDIKGFYDYVPVDGTLPVDRHAQAVLWQQMLAQLAGNPALLQQYDVAGIFGWVAKLAGLKNVDQFRLQLTDAEILQQQLQAGNVVGINEAGGAPSGPGAAVDTRGGGETEDRSADGAALQSGLGRVV